MARSTMTFEKLRTRYTAQDRERICLVAALHPECGPYLCQLAKGHEKDHEAACRKHHCCIVSWEGRQ